MLKLGIKILFLSWMFWVGSLAKSQDNFDSIFPKGENLDLSLEMSLAKADVMHDGHDIDSALIYIQHALLLIEQQGEVHASDSLTHYTYDLAAKIYYRANRPEKERFYLQRSLLIAKKTNNPHLKAKSFYSDGVLNLSYGRYEQAKPSLDSAVYYCRILNDTMRLAKSLGNLGNYFVEVSLYPQALATLKEANHLCELKGLKQAQASVLNSIGIVYRKLKQTDVATNYYARAYHIYKQLEDNYRMAGVMINIANMQSEAEQFESALQYYDSAYKMLNEAGSKEQMAGVIMNMGNIQLSLGKTQKAIDLHLAALEMAEQYSFNRLLPFLYNNLGEAYEAKNNPVIAANYYKNGLKKATSIGMIELQQINASSLYALYKKNELADSALRYFELLTVINDSITRNNANSKLDQLEMQFQAERNLAEMEKQENILKLTQEALVKQEKLQWVLAFIIALLLISMTTAFVLLIRSKKSAMLIVNQKNQIEELNKELNKALSVTTGQLAHNQKQIAEYAFFNSHKLRAPVANILGLVSILDQDQLTPEERKAFRKHLAQSAANLDEVIRDLQHILNETKGSQKAE